ncbi:hypothetical protein T492DRAFT_337106 [Pavlovales sp. CCMP2436]|nr:hypothetical protein T492DRAFT_337106 [Pavlovales sp. CCMP2436]
MAMMKARALASATEQAGGFAPEPALATDRRRWFPPEYATWRKDKRAAWDALPEQPDAFYLKYLPPGEKGREAAWTDEEETLFLRMLGEHRFAYDSKWGLFSMYIRGRTGMQCKAFYESLAKTQKLAGRRTARQRTASSPSNEADDAEGGVDVPEPLARMIAQRARKRRKKSAAQEEQVAAEDAADGAAAASADSPPSSDAEDEPTTDEIDLLGSASPVPATPPTAEPAFEPGSEPGSKGTRASLPPSKRVLEAEGMCESVLDTPAPAQVPQQAAPPRPSVAVAKIARVAPPSTPLAVTSVTAAAGVPATPIAVLAAKAVTTVTAVAAALAPPATPTAVSAVPQTPGGTVSAAGAAQTPGAYSQAPACTPLQRTQGTDAALSAMQTARAAAPRAHKERMGPVLPMPIFANSPAPGAAAKSAEVFFFLAHCSLLYLV